ncbi:helix-turn-helix transcriptional regulator [Streptomyces zhihengii]
MSAGRLLSVLLLLQSRGRMSARALADELGVSVRTAYRDLTRLQAAGIPLYAETGRAGGYRLVDGYRTRLTGMSEAEARALLFAALPGAAADLGIGDEVTAARLKLLAALPTTLREQARRTAAVFHVDAPGWYRESERTPSAAVGRRGDRRQAVDVRYRRWRAPQEVHRRLRPYGLVLKSGVWYLVAESGERTATYRVTSVLDATLTGERFDRPADFDLGAYWTSYLDEFGARRYTGTATVRLSPRGRRRLPDNVPRSSCGRSTARRPRR